MRITEDAKVQSRQRILECAQRLFSSKGFEQTTTRDITQAASIATGTLFNYFRTKEEIAVTLVAAALELAQRDFQVQSRADTALEEDLFAFIAIGLRHLQPYRKLIPAVLDAALNPFIKGASGDAADALRQRQVQTVELLVVGHGLGQNFSVAAIHLYWTLYTGLLRFWSGDSSRNHEDTLSMLDQWTQLFANSLRGAATDKGLAGAQEVCDVN
jgi:AcrR family transcriptional regulator